MTEDLDTNKVFDEKAFTADAYRDFLPFFITYFNSKEQKFIKYSGGANNTATGNWLSKSMNDKAILAQKFFKNKILDYILAKQIYDNCAIFTASTIRYWISQIESEAYRKFLLEHCKEALNRKEEVAKKEPSKTKISPSDSPTLTDMKGDKFNFEKYKNKVVYVDFWASWCGPCRQQFPFSKKLHEELTEKQRKNIVFLYISIDEDLGAWKNAIEKLELKNGEHGYSEGGWGAEVVRKYKINGIPRYMIIDKKGAIVQPEAPRPSDPNLKDILIKLME
jgi:thiol-disulfide isomerase/thioredoxin